MIGQDSQCNLAPEHVRRGMATQHARHVIAFACIVTVRYGSCPTAAQISRSEVLHMSAPTRALPSPTKANSLHSASVTVPLGEMAPGDAIC